MLPITWVNVRASTDSRSWVRVETDSVMVAGHEALEEDRSWVRWALRCCGGGLRCAHGVGKAYLVRLSKFPIAIDQVIEGIERRESKGSIHPAL